MTIKEIKKSTHKIDVRLPTGETIRVFHVWGIDGDEWISLEQGINGHVEIITLPVGSLGQLASNLTSLGEYFHPATPPVGGPQQLQLFPT